MDKSRTVNEKIIHDSTWGIHGDNRQASSLCKLSGVVWTHERRDQQSVNVVKPACYSLQHADLARLSITITMAVPRLGGAPVVLFQYCAFIRPS
jgi:hypothetical protein